MRVVRANIEQEGYFIDVLQQVPAAKLVVSKVEDAIHKRYSKA
jgi:DNA-binding FrmR family transcriptional regulator